MKRYVRAVTAKINEALMLTLLDEASKEIAKKIETRGLDEYIDDVKWGNDRFEVPIFRADNPENVFPVTKFKFVYDPDDIDDAPVEDQMHLQLAEFFEEWDADSDEDEEMTHEDFIESAISDEVYNCYQKRKNYQKLELSEDEIADIVSEALQEPPYNLLEDEDFTKDQILEEMDEYFWDAE